MAGGEQSLVQAIEQRTLGKGSVAGTEYLRNMQDARLCSDGTARWVEVCYCPAPPRRLATRQRSLSIQVCRYLAMPALFFSDIIWWPLPGSPTSSSFTNVVFTPA